MRTQSDSDTRIQRRNLYENTFIASSISGFCGAYAAFFFEATKKRLQSNQKLPNFFATGLYRWSRESFRGSISFSLCTTPTMVVQQLSDAYCKNNFAQSSFVGNASALSSGALGGVVSTTVENMLLCQQLTKKNGSDAFFTLINESRFRLFRGLWLIMMREAIFGFCYLRGVKHTGQYAKENWGEQFVLPTQIVTGVLCAIFSHPFDTTATIMQRYGYKYARDAASHLWNESRSLKSFYRGVIPRAALFTTAVMTINFVDSRVRSILECKRA